MILSQLLGEDAIGIGTLQEFDAKTNVTQELQSALTGDLRKERRERESQGAVEVGGRTC